MDPTIRCHAAKQRRIQIKNHCIKDIQTLKMSITTANGLKAVNIFKDPKQKMSQDKFYFLMDGMISRGLFEKVE
ncbi:DUF1831 domain-containing protein [Enterococcus faecium]|nr:DUF1831 domain-containing protein [Enterococcus faecium]